MHKFVVSLDAHGGGKNGKEIIMEVSKNNRRPTSNKEGVATLSMEVSLVGMTLAGVVGPCGSW